VVTLPFITRHRSRSSSKGGKGGKSSTNNNKCLYTGNICNSGNHPMGQQYRLLTYHHHHRSEQPLGSF
jgi:hypothetical protein